MTRFARCFISVCSVLLAAGTAGCSSADDNAPANETETAAFSAATFRVGNLDLTPTGSVLGPDYRPAGAWTVNANNELVVGSQLPLNVTWTFKQNKLVLSTADGTELWNFRADRDPTIRPGFYIVDGAIEIVPDTIAAPTFKLRLRGSWSLSASGLTFKPQGSSPSSELTGILNSPDGRLAFIFNEKERPLLVHKLLFRGDWEALPASADKVKLRFRYAREALTVSSKLGEGDVLDLPGQAQRGANELRYRGAGRDEIKIPGRSMQTGPYRFDFWVTRQFDTQGGLVVRETVLRDLPDVQP